MLGFKLRIEGGPNQIQLRSGAVSSPHEDDICGGEITTDGILMSSSKNVSSSIFDCTWEINIPDVSSIMIYPEVLEIEPHSIDWFGMEQDCRWNYLKIDWKDKNEFRKENKSKARHFSYEFCSIEEWGSNPYNWVNPTTTTTTTTTSTISKNRKTGLPQENLGREQTYVGDFSEPLKIKGGKATIKYRYDAWLNGPDFMFIKSRFKLRIEGKSCNQVQTGAGAVTSPGWPENYNNDEKCKYTLNAEPGKIIKITFDEFDVETSTKCKNDFLEIMGRKYCGNSGRKSPKGTVTIYAESTELLWSSDKMITSKGFSFSWESVDNPVQLQSGALESAAGFNSHMDLFVMQLHDQMVSREWNLRRPKRFEALSQIWDNVKIAQQQFQTGDCYTDFGYKSFDLKVFDGSQSICKNLDSFRSNAGIFFGNFVCNPKEDFLNSPTFYKWHKMVNEIDTICDPF